MRVVIMVRGGVVQAVRSDSTDISVAVLDYDNVEPDEMDTIELEAHRNLKREFEGLQYEPI